MSEKIEEMPQYAVFKGGSKTYFNSSLFFPEAVRRDVFVLYGFVRVADDFVDATPQREEAFAKFCKAWEQAECGRPSGNPIIDDFVELSGRRHFESSWTRAFLASMATDIGTVAFNTLGETLTYIYGSAEVIGLFMSRIMNLPDKALPHARLLGRAMQYINFLRDIAEDNSLGRRYLPLENSGLGSLEESEARSNPRAFRSWFRRQSGLCQQWHRAAALGYRYIPRRYLIPIRTAEDMYMWTADVLNREPLRVFERKVKPKSSKIRRRALLNAFIPALFKRNRPISADIPGGMNEPVIKDFRYIRGTCEDEP